MRGFKTFVSADSFCPSYDELRNFLWRQTRHNQSVSASPRRKMHLRHATTALAVLKAAQATLLLHHRSSDLARVLTESVKPRTISADKNQAYPCAMAAMKLDRELWRFARFRQAKFLNNVVEQDHRRLKRLVRPGLGFRSFHTARRTLAGYETMAMIRRGQVDGIGGRDLRARAGFIAKLLRSPPDFAPCCGRSRAPPVVATEPPWCANAVANGSAATQKAHRVRPCPAPNSRSAASKTLAV
jgi:hypothetical protein